MMAGRYLEGRGWSKNSPGIGHDLNTVMSQRLDVSVETVIDVGASNGCWSERMMRHFPNAKYLLVEAQEATHRSALEKFQTVHSNVLYELCAAGDREGETHFHASGPVGGVASSTPFAKNDITVPMKPIDGLVQRRSLCAPYLLKLDTHGFEVPILEGARTVLSQTSMLIIEAYNFTLCPGALRFCELTTYLEKRGFRCVDMFDLMWRPGDNALWQMDMVFLPSTHPVFRSDVYQSDEREL
jgi:FkbM family methyltransferase